MQYYAPCDVDETGTALVLHWWCFVQSHHQFLLGPQKTANLDMESMVLSRLEHDLHMVIFRYVSFLDGIEIISTFWGVKIHLPVLEGSVPAVEIQGAKAPRPGKIVAG